MRRTRACALTSWRTTIGIDRACSHGPVMQQYIQQLQIIEKHRMEPVTIDADTCGVEHTLGAG
eukprot:11458055-Alexandrium_andersonii.AAC.1